MGGDGDAYLIEVFWEIGVGVGWVLGLDMFYSKPVPASL